MRRFKFSLESVLILREKALEDAQKQLALIVGVYNKQKEILNEMIYKLQSIQQESENYITQFEFNPQLVANYSSFSLKLSSDIEMQEKIIERTKQDVLRQQEITKQAYIKVKSLETLKEKQKEDYKKELLIEENKLIDDIVNSRRIRKG